MESNSTVFIFVSLPKGVQLLQESTRKNLLFALSKNDPCLEVLRSAGKHTERSEKLFPFVKIATKTVRRTYALYDKFPHYVGYNKFCSWCR